jgi:hypothetical protein
VECVLNLDPQYLNSAIKFSDFIAKAEHELGTKGGYFKKIESPPPESIQGIINAEVEALARFSTGIEKEKEKTEKYFDEIGKSLLAFL